MITAPAEQICELCCGAGGMGLGFSQHFEIAQAIDISRDAIRTYGANHPNTDIRKRDIRNITGCRGDFGGITGIIGGPPCLDRAPPGPVGVSEEAL